MSEPNRPWLVAVWPGMGQVAVSAGYYLMSKLGMRALAEVAARELFDVEQIEVKEGLIRPGRLPRNQFFIGKDPTGQRDIIVFIGESQPPLGKYSFCQKILDFARKSEVERVFTFAAMVTNMHPQREPRVFAAATNPEMLKSLDGHGLKFLEEGQINGLNGILLGAAVEAEMDGICLLGEMPHLFGGHPFPAAPLAILRKFSELGGFQLDLSELEAEVESMNERLGELLANAEQNLRNGGAEEEPEEFGAEAIERKLTTKQEREIEELFGQARADKAKAYELKQLLDRLNAFGDYEDRFLDLFKSE
ncbi:MAG: proteasome assembly chaperone family protein [Planctomycetota bacterium]